MRKLKDEDKVKTDEFLFLLDGAYLYLVKVTPEYIVPIYGYDEEVHYKKIEGFKDSFSVYLHQDRYNWAPWTAFKITHLPYSLRKGVNKMLRSNNIESIKYAIDIVKSYKKK